MDKEKMALNQKFITENADKLLNVYRNKYVLIHEQEVIGSFDTYEAAAEEGVNAYGIDGDFMVHYVTESAPVNFISTALI